MQKCQISNCLEMFKSLKSFRQDVEKSHWWFYEAHIVYFKIS